MDGGSARPLPGERRRRRQQLLQMQLLLCMLLLLLMQVPSTAAAAVPQPKHPPPTHPEHHLPPPQPARWFMERPCPARRTLYGDCVQVAGSATRRMCVAWQENKKQSSEDAGATDKPMARPHHHDRTHDGRAHVRIRHGTRAQNGKARCKNVQVVEIDHLMRQGIEEIADVPLSNHSAEHVLDLSENLLQKLPMMNRNWEQADWETIRLDGNRFDSFAAISLPQSVAELYVRNNSITTLDLADNYTELRKLDVSLNPITRITSMPSRLKTLLADGIAITSFHTVTLPDSIRTLVLSHHQIENWKLFDPPQDLEILDASNGKAHGLTGINFAPCAAFLDTLNFSHNNISIVKGVRFPRTLSKLDLSGNDISHFELRESDVDILEKLTDFRVGAMATPTCNAQATKKDMDIVGNNYQFCVISNSAFDTLYNTTRTKAKATPGSAWMVPMILTTASLAVLVFFAGLYVISKRSSNEYEKGVGSGGRRRISSPPASQGYLPDDVRQDADLVQRRIPLNDLVRGRLIGKGGYGTIHLARWIKNDTDVALKQLLPDKAKDPAAIVKFMNEIRLCAQLDHPNVVAFLGLTWSSLGDLGIVFEYMPRGHLASVLTRMRATPNYRQQFTWTFTTSDLPTKLEFARDIASVLKYLHHREKPIIHRDIKAQNVLLSSTWAAKLSDFGVSQVVATDMSAEIGTVSWIAPEILKGAQYNEQADIYSFGVLMSELDTCKKPYSEGVPDVSGVTISEPSDARIALAVSENRVRPKFVSDCPAEIRYIALECLSHDPAARPTANELYESLVALNFAADRKQARVSRASKSEAERVHL